MKKTTKELMCIVCRGRTTGHAWAESGSLASVCDGCISRRRKSVHQKPLNAVIDDDTYIKLKAAA